MNQDYRARLFPEICKADTPGRLLAVARAAAALHPWSADGAMDPEELLVGDVPLALYGAGRFAKSVLEHWLPLGVRPAFCVDNNPKLWGKQLLGIPIAPVAALEEQRPAPRVVVAAMISGGIAAELAGHGLPCLFAERDGQVGYLPGWHLLRAGADLERLWPALADDHSRRVLLAACKARLFQGIHFEMVGSPFLHQVASAPQYFQADLLDFANGETWVDCGAFDGDFVVGGHAFMHAAGRTAPAIHAFEADADNLARLRRTVRDYGLENIHLHHALVGGADGWCAEPDFNNCRADGTIAPVRRVTLDSALEGREAHFVKMDIEGAEPEALAGARNLIGRWHPKLAICVYHETRHLLDIPLSLHDPHSGYRIYLRHHSTHTLWETVCYAAPG